MVLADVDVGFDIGADDVCVAGGSGEPPAFKSSSFNFHLELLAAFKLPPLEALVFCVLLNATPDPISSVV
jgi:hypothetical protein